MKYIAHKDDEREQSLKEHLEGTAKLAAGFAEGFGAGEWGYFCGMIHDIGKYSDEFQRRIRGDEIRVDHSTAGAQLCLKKGGPYGFMGYCIAGHHAGMPDFGMKEDDGTSPTLMGKGHKKVKNYQAYQEEIAVPEITASPLDLRKTSNPGFTISVFIRMLYSCLVDADYLDTEYFMQAGKVERASGESMESLLQKLETHIDKWLKQPEDNTINGRRTEILKACLNHGESERGLFRLTVPTGGGKTIASLAFALRHAVKNQMNRVIYVIPYTSIIEQNAAVFREILGDKNVLENHYNVNYDDSEEFMEMKLAAENWDKPVVVTTNVQFFESLFGNRSAQCRKLHNIANSVIIFDEAQMLPNDYLKPCIAMVEELLRQYKVSAVLCTATQPSLGSFFQTYKNATELCPRMQEQFDFFRRVSYEKLGEITEEELLRRLAGEYQALCIVNTKKRAQKLYRQICEDMGKEGVYHLSTCMYPKHRKRVLQAIRNRLKADQKCIVISTSLVEAGVDLDFQTVYRQLAGIDSLIQAAGRGNREGKRKAEDSKVYVFKLAGEDKVPGQEQQIETAESIFKDDTIEIDSPDTVTKYFDMLYHMKGESLDKKKIMDEFLIPILNFAKVGKEFKLIEQETKTIFIPLEEESIEILQQLKFQGFTKTLMRRAGQYSVNIYEKEWQNLYNAGMIREVSENIPDFYELVSEKQYTEDVGLKLDVEEGIALIL